MSVALRTFEEHHPFLVKLALTLSAKRSEAEDLVHETYLRWQRLDLETVQKPRALLATILSHLALNQKTSARARREVVVEPGGVVELQEAESKEKPDLSDSLMKAFEIVLSRMSPNERSVFLLREIFDWDYVDISRVLEESETNCRQIFRRARQRLMQDEVRYAVSEDEPERTLERFLCACRSGDPEMLLHSLREDALLIRDATDTGLPQPPPVCGRKEICRYLEKVLPGLADHLGQFRRLTHHEWIAVFLSAGKLEGALICSIEQNSINRVQHLSCPKRLHLLNKLLGNSNGD